MKLLKTAAALAASTAVFGGAALADVIVLDFEGIETSYPFANSTFVNSYYDGGAASNGNVGPDLGIEFSDNALVVCLNSEDVTCSNASRGGEAPDSAQAGLFFLTGDAAIMNVGAGFTDGFSFAYSAINQTGIVQVYSGLDGAGDLLASIDLALTASACADFDAGFCPFTDIGVAFAGTAMSVVFGGVENQIAFDDITFGSAIVGGEVPVPGAFLLMGTAVAGGAYSRRKAKKA